MVTAWNDPVGVIYVGCVWGKSATLIHFVNICRQETINLIYDSANKFTNILAGLELMSVVTSSSQSCLVASGFALTLRRKRGW